jgi:hypothetical protein
MHVVHNERIKLAANLFNIAAPVAAVMFGQLPRLAPVAIGAVIWFIVVCVLHPRAQYLLGALRDD